MHLQVGNSIFQVRKPLGYKSQAGVKALQMGLSPDGDAAARPLMLVERNAALHKLPAQLTASSGRCDNDPTDRTLRITQAWRQTALVGQQRVPRATLHVHTARVEAVEILIKAVLLDDEHRLAQLQNLVKLTRA